MFWGGGIFQPTSVGERKERRWGHQLASFSHLKGHLPLEQYCPPKSFFLTWPKRFQLYVCIINSIIWWPWPCESNSLTLGSVSDSELQPLHSEVHHWVEEKAMLPHGLLQPVIEHSRETEADPPRRHGTPLTRDFGWGLPESLAEPSLKLPSRWRHFHQTSSFPSPLSFTGIRYLSWSNSSPNSSQFPLHSPSGIFPDVLHV